MKDGFGQVGFDNAVLSSVHPDTLSFLTARPSSNDLDANKELGTNSTSENRERIPYRIHSCLSGRTNRAIIMMYPCRAVKYKWGANKNTIMKLDV